MVKVNVVQIGSLIPRQMILLKDARSDSGEKKKKKTTQMIAMAAERDIM